jgi:hypothetical protein
VTGLQEFDHDISGGFGVLDHSGFPLSMILHGRKDRRSGGKRNAETEKT